MTVNLDPMWILVAGAGVMVVLLVSLGVYVVWSVRRELEGRAYSQELVDMKAPAKKAAA